MTSIPRVRPKAHARIKIIILSFGSLTFATSYGSSFVFNSPPYTDQQFSSDATHLLCIGDKLVLNVRQQLVQHDTPRATVSH